MESLQSADGTELHFCVDSVADEGTEERTRKGAILLVHGFGEHCGRYDAFVSALNSWGYSCMRFDYRGHGRSQGKRGHVDSYQDYIDDLRCAQAHFKTLYPQGPHFLLGHSNGGLISFLSLQEDQSSWDGVVLSSPFFGFEIKIPLWKRVLGKGMSRLVPQFQLPTDLQGSQVSHDPAVIQAYDQDPLMGRVASARWLTEVLKAHTFLEEIASNLEVPILMQVAGADALASTSSTRDLFERVSSPDQTLNIYEDLFHEIWFELEKQKVLDDLHHTLDRWSTSSEDE